MAVVSKTITAATDNALEGKRFTNPASSALVSLWLTGAAAGDSFSFGVGEFLVADGVAIPLESADRVVDVSRDQRLFQELMPPGQMVLQIPAVTGADITYLLNIETL